MTRPGNLLADLPASLPAEVFQQILTAPGLRIERIISPGHASPAGGGWYDQADDEWVLVLAGAARLRFEGDATALDLAPGDHVHIPARRRHRVEWTQPDRPTVWLAVHYAAAGPTTASDDDEGRGA